MLLATWAGSLPGNRGKCHAIAKRQPNPHLSAILDDAQNRMGFTPIYNDGTPVQVVGECLKLLKRGARLGIAPDQDSKYGALLAPGIDSHVHQHVFSFRFDMCIDGEKNSVTEVQFEPEPVGPNNPHGNAIGVQETFLRSERAAQREIDSSR